MKIKTLSDSLMKTVFAIFFDIFVDGLNRRRDRLSNDLMLLNFACLSTVRVDYSENHLVYCSLFLFAQKTKNDGKLWRFNFSSDNFMKFLQILPPSR